MEDTGIDRFRMSCFLSTKEYQDQAIHMRGVITVIGWRSSIAKTWLGV